MQNLKEKTIRGGLARICAQGANFGVRLGSLMILARLLSPNDFGLVGMVTAFTGVLVLFRDFGLSSAAIQSSRVTEEQLSTLFWINLLVGFLLAAIAAVLAPAVAAFYHDRRLISVTIVLGAGFLFNAAGVQHGALLQRQMRFTVLAVINTVSLVLSTGVAIIGARAGYGYWSLVAMAVTASIVTTLGVWLAAAWVPGLPRRGAGILSMMRFGGALTTNVLVVYIASNFEKVLLARYWGAAALGIYGRAYQLINIPTDNLNSAAGEVAFSALSRLQDEPRRLKSYFLKGYAVVLAMTLPVTTACFFFADDVVRVVLGPKWMSAAPIFRLLAPTVMVFAIANPLSWLVLSLGKVRREVKMSMVIAPLMILSYFLGLQYGPKGVAFAYSAIMLLWLIPVIAWSVHGTVISFWDVAVTVSKPFTASMLAGVLALGFRSLYGHLFSPLPQLLLEVTLLLGAFLGILLFPMRQKHLYLDIFRGMVRDSSARTMPVTPTIEADECDQAATRDYADVRS